MQDEHSSAFGRSSSLWPFSNGVSLSKNPGNILVSIREQSFQEQDLPLHHPPEESFKQV